MDVYHNIPCFSVHFILNRISTMKIPGLSFSWKRAVGLTAAKQKFARKTGIPTSRSGLERKVGAAVIGAIFGKKKR